MRILPVLALVLVPLAGCTDNASDPGDPLATLAVDLQQGATMRIVASVYNTGDTGFTLAGDCREWGMRAVGPLGNLTVDPEGCDGTTEVPVGGTASRAWTWEAVRVHEQVGSLHQVQETPVEGAYSFEVTFRAPQGPLTRTVVHQQDVVPSNATSGEGPGSLGWRVWSWPGHASLENRGDGHAPVAWSPCGVALSGVDPDGTPTVPACPLERTRFQLRPGFALHVTGTTGTGAAAHFIDPAGDHALLVVQREGPDAGRSWFTGSWMARTGAPVVVTENGTFAAHDTAHQGAVLIGSTDRNDTWAALRNDGDRPLRYLTGCGMPWALPEAGCVPRPAWLLPGGDLVDPDPPQDGIYRFYWTPGDVLGHRI